MNKKKKIEIPVMFCFDKNYVIPAAVAFYSLLENANKNYQYHFYVLHSDISEQQQEKLQQTICEFKDYATLEFIDMNQRFDDLWNQIYKGGHFSKEVMYKILIASIFPQYDKIIVTDVDVVFLGDISPSYLEFDCEEDYYIAGIKPIGKIKDYMKNYESAWSKEEIKKLGHMCGGYLVANLKKIREDHMEEEFIDCFVQNGSRLNQMEQDILNLCCYSKIKYLPLNYVSCSYNWDYYKTDESMHTDETYSYEEIKDAMEHPIQLHYATSIKPWKNVDCTKSEEWFQYIVKTPFLREYLESLPKKIIIENPNGKQQKQEQKRGIIYRTLRYIKHHPNFFLKKNFYQKIMVVLRRKLSFLRKKEIVYICDDMFPSKLSAFRYEEFLTYLNSFSYVRILSKGDKLNQIGETRSMEQIMKEFYEEHPNHQNKITLFPFPYPAAQEEFEQQMIQFKRKIAIIDFLNTLYSNEQEYLRLLENYNIPFIFTLYPGGGFALHNKEVDEKLKRVFSSPMFQKVIVTQKVTKDYLVDNDFCKEEQIEFIYGVVVPQSLLACNLEKKRQFKTKNKKTLDICFVAYKYMKEGKDKGYDLFIKAAKKLSKMHSNIHFHIIGTFDQNDIDVTEIKDKIHFYGPQSTEWFKEFYLDKDIILSPNRANQLTGGAFDGFPTGSAVEAMLHKVALFATDELKQNLFFEDKKDFVLIQPEVTDMVEKIEYYYQNPKKLNQIAENGYQSAQKFYSFETQLKNRVDIIKKELKK